MWACAAYQPAEGDFGSVKTSIGSVRQQVGVSEWTFAVPNCCDWECLSIGRRQFVVFFLLAKRPSKLRLALFVDRWASALVCETFLSASWQASVCGVCAPVCVNVLLHTGASVCKPARQNCDRLLFLWGIISPIGITLLYHRSSGQTYHSHLGGLCVVMVVQNRSLHLPTNFTYVQCVSVSLFAHAIRGYCPSRSTASLVPGPNHIFPRVYKSSRCFYEFPV